MNNQKIPGVLWVALVTMGVVTVGNLLATARHGCAGVIGAALCAALLVGLYKGHKWAYLLVVVIVPVKFVLLVLSAPFINAFAILMLDCMVLVPVLMSRSYFWGRTCVNSLCGFRNKKDARFCARCGGELTARAAAKSA